MQFDRSNTANLDGTRHAKILELSDATHPLHSRSAQGGSKERAHQRMVGYAGHVLVPRLIRLRDAPYFFGMDKNRFNREIRPCSPRSGLANRAAPSIGLKWSQ